MILHVAYTGDTISLNKYTLSKSNSLSDLRKYLEDENYTYEIEGASLLIISYNESKALKFEEIIEDNDDVYDFNLNWDLAVTEGFDKIRYKEFKKLIEDFHDTDEPELLEANNTYIKYKEHLDIIDYKA